MHMQHLFSRTKWVFLVFFSNTFATLNQFFDMLLDTLPSRRPTSPFAIVYKFQLYYIVHVLLLFLEKRSGFKRNY